MLEAEHNLSVPMHLQQLKNICIRPIGGGAGQRVRGPTWGAGVVKYRGKVRHSTWGSKGLAPKKIRILEALKSHILGYFTVIQQIKLSSYIVGAERDKP